jgi:hypothetical protein
VLHSKQGNGNERQHVHEAMNGLLDRQDAPPILRVTRVDVRQKRMR